MAVNNQMGGFGANDPTAPTPFMPVAPVDPSAQPGMLPADAPAYPAGMTPNVPDPAKAFAATAPAAAPGAAPGGPPDPAAAFSASQPQQYATETTKSTTTSGMSDKDIAEQRTANKGAEDAQGRAAASEGEQRRLEVEAQEQEQTRLLNEAAEQQKKIAAKQAVVDLENAEVKNKLQAGADWRPDRSELFSGSTGAARGILAAVAVMAGGWMQGRGMTRDNQFMSAIERMIDENVKDQVRHNSSTMQFLREQKGDIGAAAAELKARQMQYALQKVNARAALSKIPAAQQGVRAFNDAAAARTAEWHAEQEKALRKSVSSTISKHTAPVAPAGDGAGKPPAERSAEQAKAQSAVDAINAFGEKAGLVRDKDGKWTVGKGISPTLVEDLNPFDDDEIRASADAAVEAFGRLQSGGVIGAEEADAFRSQLGHGKWNRGKLAARLNATGVALQGRLRSTDAAAQTEATTVPSTWRPLGTR